MLTAENDIPLDNTERPDNLRAQAQAQMRKGVLELCILSILSQGDAYPTGIIDKLRDTKLVVVEGNERLRPGQEVVITRMAAPKNDQSMRGLPEGGPRK